MSRHATKECILDAAEAMFAELGYAATSLRRLTAEAKVNLAAVNYHFGSKEDLAKAVLARRIGPINAERLRRLAALTAGRPPSAAAIVRAFVEPPLRSTGTAETTPAAAHALCRVFGRISVEQPPFLRTFLTGQFREVGSRFAAALADAMPGLSPATLWWRLHFVVGAMAHTLQNSATLAQLSEGLCVADDVDALVEHLVAFATGGLRAREVAAPTRRRMASAARRAPRREVRRT